MAKFTDYTEKTEPVDTDLVLIYDTQAKVNKKFTFGNLWKWIAKKIVSEGISQLDTTNKTIPGAINELNSKSIRTKKITELFYFSVTATTGSQYGDFSFYFDEFEYNNDPAISINPIDGVSFVINSFLRNNTTRKINGVLLQARKNGTWLVNTKLSVTGTILGQ